LFIVLRGVPQSNALSQQSLHKIGQDSARPRLPSACLCGPHLSQPLAFGRRADRQDHRGVRQLFCHANDPHKEHDFGAFDVDGHTIMFKIDYFDRQLSMHLPDPADPAVTQRVITIILAEEY
jgi:hypothetical protein